ncbi:MAG: metallophosphoesterase [Planctomycetes bacterium DG_23]|nr:MAG: metallophosphoesterase [Planctomycetes bacterium DG_23]
MPLNILLVGDVVGKPGRRILQENLPNLIAEREIDFTLVNGENAAGGTGLTPQATETIFGAGADVITGGDHIWHFREIIPILAKNERVLRPANLSPKAAGTGVTLLDSRAKVPIGVINLLGRIFTRPADDPFRTAEAALEELAPKTKIILVDFHAEATSEKVAMGWFLDGKVTAVAGTHTHIQTADERILPQGTAYITDLGMTGPYQSIIGRRVDRVLQAITTDMPAPFDVAKEDVRLAGVIVKADAETGKALSIERLFIKEEDLKAR